MPDPNPPDNPVSRTMLLTEVVAKYPRAADVMMRYGLHCFGCHASQFETIEQGAAGHGMTPDEIDTMLKEVNEHVSQAPPEGLDFTDKAVEKVKELLSAENKDSGFGLRIQIVPGGCSGYSYDFSFDNEVHPDDAVMEKNGLRVIVDRQSLSLIGGSRVDYVDGLHGSGFKVSNPNARHSCGCGSSFG